MYNVKVLNKIAQKGLNILGDDFNVTDNLDVAHGIMLRSYKMHELDLPQTLLGVARAGAGVNNIPIDKCSERGIVVFNTPGANANGVKELVIAGLLLASRQIIPAIEWAKDLDSSEGDISKLVEKGKSNFKGSEVYGKKLGVIGLGAIGVMVANSASALGLKVIGYDPFISVESAWGLSNDVDRSNDLEKLLSECDYITIHVPLSGKTKNMIDDRQFKDMKKGIKLLNFARDGLINNEALVKAIDDEIVDCYITDFPNKLLLNKHNVISIPHLGASTEESEENCAVMAAVELKDYLENGNITNSVNYPKCDMGKCESVCRLTVNHKNIPKMVGQITQILAEREINIDVMNNRSKGGWAYTVLDIEQKIDQETIKLINEIDGVVKVRVLD